MIYLDEMCAKPAISSDSESQCRLPCKITPVENLLNRLLSFSLSLSLPLSRSDNVSWITCTSVKLNSNNGETRSPCPCLNGKQTIGPIRLSNELYIVLCKLTLCLCASRETYYNANICEPGSLINHVFISFANIAFSYTGYKFREAFECFFPLTFFFPFFLFSSSKKSFVLGYIDLIIRLWIILRIYDLSWKIDLIYDI